MLDGISLLLGVVNLGHTGRLQEVPSNVIAGPLRRLGYGGQSFVQVQEVDVLGLSHVINEGGIDCEILEVEIGVVLVYFRP